MLIILFQAEIRQVLERVNPLKVLGIRRLSSTEDWVHNLVEAVTSLARRRIGALVILQGVDRVEEWISGGLEVDAEPNPQFLLSMFQKESPLHDGAMLIRNGRVSLVAGYLPLSSAEGLPKDWGTRHRAALGLSERCDASVLVVSEERGAVSLARAGKVRHIKNEEELSLLILEGTRPGEDSKSSWIGKAGSLVTNRWPVKIGTLLFVTVLWLLFAGQQDFEVALSVPLRTKNLPANLEIVEPQRPELVITVRGLRKDASTLNERNVHAELDLSLAALDRRTFRVSREHILLPSETISIVGIEPPNLEFTFQKNQ
jgi:hypothetical protein